MKPLPAALLVALAGLATLLIWRGDTRDANAVNNAGESRPTSTQGEDQLLIATEDAGGRTNATAKIRNTAPAAEPTLPDAWVRGTRFATVPRMPPSVEDIALDPNLNPCAAALTREQLASAQAAIDYARLALPAYRERITVVKHEWLNEKVLGRGEGADPESEEARILYADARGEDCLVLNAAINLKENGIVNKVVRLDPGEFPPLDSAYDDAWLVLEQVGAELLAVFSEACSDIQAGEGGGH